MLEQLEAGLHPDTHFNFWDGFADEPDMVKPKQGVALFIAQVWYGNTTARLEFSLGVLVIGAIVIKIRRDRSRAKKQLENADPVTNASA